MSGRHQNTTFLPLELDRLTALRDAAGDVAALTSVLSSVPRDPDANAEHCESVWARESILEGMRPYLLRRFLRADPPRWAPLLATDLLQAPDDFVDDTFDELSSNRELELYGVPDCYGVLLYVSSAYAKRFGVDAPLADADALRDAFGGEPDASEHDLRSALRDVTYSSDEVRRIAAAIEVPGALPALDWSLPHGVEAFDVDPAHLLVVIADVAECYRRTAEAGLAMCVRWHPNA